MEAPDLIRPVSGFLKRGFRVKSDGTLVINATGTTDDLYEIRPKFVPGLGPVIVFYDVSGTEDRYLMTLTVRGALNMVRNLRYVINAAERLSRSANNPK